MTTITRQFFMLALMGLFTLLTVVSWAQEVSNVCQTYYGICNIQQPIPIGSTCYCGNDPGRIVHYPQQNMQRVRPLNDACATAYGVCRVKMAPIGSSCFCGRDPGRIIGR